MFIPPLPAGFSYPSSHPLTLSPSVPLTLSPSTVQTLQGKHVVFGKVTSGMDVVKMCESVGTRNGPTKVPVVIEDCGELKGKST